MIPHLQTNFEIWQLRTAELEAEVGAREADRLVGELLPHYACDFVVVPIPDGMWLALPEGWQAGLSEPLPPRTMDIPQDHRGAVAVSLPMLRRLVEAVR